MSLVTISLLLGIPGAAPGTANSSPPAQMLVDYFEAMCQPAPFAARSGSDFERHRQATRKKLLHCVGLNPLPERVPLNIRMSEPLTHPWCTVRRVYFQLWPGVSASALLYTPEMPPHSRAPAVLSPHGHWTDGNRHPDVQRRCLTLARAGYVVLSTGQYHYEDLPIGISHQTVMIWNNMRALDALESLDEVDAQRIGVCGASGGGLQTQMLTALDPRVKAAVIVGLTCDFREILFPYQPHCDCNHYPNVMQFTDAPEISALACPTPVLYLTMNDWTGHFMKDNFPTIKALYDEHGASDHVQCIYEPTPHAYDRSKRAITYSWMDQHLRSTPGATIEEPESVETFPPEALAALALDSADEGDFTPVSRQYKERFGYTAPDFESKEDLQAYCRSLKETLPTLLGLPHALPPTPVTTAESSTTMEGGLVLDSAAWPSEGPVHVPTAILRNQRGPARRPVVILCDAAGKEASLNRQGPGSAVDRAAHDALAVLPDIRFVGEMSFTKLAGEVGPGRMHFKPASPLGMPGDSASQVKGLTRAWQRNAIVWGRPIPGMACTDILSVLSGVARRDDADMTGLAIVARGSGNMAIAALFAAVIDPRIAEVDLDFMGCCFSNGKLPTVPFVLRHGDLLQWGALLADRRLTLRNLPPEAGDPGWLRNVFNVMGNPDGLIIANDDR
jgi:pimeloyl-ACP methyl ester carboxylesterase